MGFTIAVLGAGLAAILAGIGSVLGVQMAGRAANGVVAEKPELFGKVLILEALPGTQGIYGFLAAVLVMNQLGVLGGVIPDLPVELGWAYFGACMPIAIVGLVSAFFQGKTAIAAIHMTAKQPDASAKGMTMTALVETYAILTLLVTILIVINLPIA